MGQGDELGGAVSSTFGEIFSSLFKPNADKQAEIDRAYAEQLEILERRRNPKAYAAKLKATEDRRKREAAVFREKFAWQNSKDPLAEFKKRRANGQIKDLNYEGTPKGGIPMPMASFGVGGEFGQGGRYDNGERFDLRLPYADQGWVDETSGTMGGLFRSGARVSAKSQKQGKSAKGGAKQVETDTSQSKANNSLWKFFF